MHKGFIMKLQEKIQFHKPITTSREFFKNNVGVKCVHYGDIYKNYSEKTIPSSCIINNFANEVSSDKLLYCDSIIVPDVTETVSDWGHFTYIKYDGTPYINGTHAVALTCESEDELKYIFRYLSSNHNRKRLQTLLNGSTVFQISIKDFGRFLLENYHESQDEQSHIVDILGTLDDKIENLEEINSKLQNYCIAKYRLLFSDVERIPLSNIAAITMGQSPAGNTLNDEDGVVFYQGRTDFGFRYPTVRLFTTDPKRMAKAGDVLLSVRAPVGDVNIASEDCCIGRGIAAVSSEYNSFVYYSILNQKTDFDIYNNSGTIFGSINRDALSAFKIPAANISLIETFESMASDVDKSIHNNTKEIDKLRTLKQTYLQKFFG